jgi:exonuclease VII small subunit
MPKSTRAPKQPPAPPTLEERLAELERRIAALEDLYIERRIAALERGERWG